MIRLMISLDKNFLDRNSNVSRRTLANFCNDNLTVLVPGDIDSNINLSDKIRVYSVGGNKIVQFFRILILGNRIIKRQGVEEITVQDPFFTALIGLFLSKKHKIRLEIQVHGDFYSSEYYKNSGCKFLIRYWLGKILLPRANSIRVVGERVKNSLIKMGIREEKIYVNPIEIDLEKIKISQPIFDLHQKYPDYKKIFLFLGRFDQVKNIPWLVKVFTEVVKMNQESLLLLVGRGAEEKRIKDTIKQNKIEHNIKIEPWTNDVISYLKTADCLIFPSLSEGYGMVIVEAVAANCKVIMSDVGVANFEIKGSEQVRILKDYEDKKWIEEMLKI